MRTCLYYFCDKKFKPKSKIHVYCCKEHRDVCAINKSKIKKRMKIYRQVAKEKIARQKKIYKKRMGEKAKFNLLKRNKKYRQTHREKINAYSKWWRENKKKPNRENELYRERKTRLYNKLFKSQSYLDELERDRKQRMYDKLFKSQRWYSDVFRKQVHNVFRRRASLEHKKKRSQELLGATFDEVKTWIESKWTDGMNWDNYGEWHMDHKIPCSSFDLSDPEQQKICFHYSNLQPLWRFDNLSKGAKIL